MATSGKHAGTDLTDTFDRSGDEGAYNRAVDFDAHASRPVRSSTTSPNQSDSALGSYAEGPGSRPSANFEGLPNSENWFEDQQYRDSYVSQMDSLHRVRKKRKKKKRALAIVLSVLAAIILLAAAAVAWYVHNLDSTMSLGTEAEQVNAALTETPANKAFYVLLIGSDSREGTNGKSAQDQRSDVMMLARIDTASKRITLLTVPRDTPWLSSSGKYVKLNSVYETEGTVATINAVQTVTGVKISHFAEIHISEFQQMVDTLGGITVDVPQELSFTGALSGEAFTLEPGLQTINGEQAEILVRDRFDYEDHQDMNRQKTIRMVVEAMLNKIKAEPVSNLPGVVSSAAKCVSTDMTSAELIQLASDMRTGTTLYSGTGPNAGDIDPAADDLWLCYQNPTGWQRVMQVVDSGGDPSTVTYENDPVTVAGTDQAPENPEGF